VTRTRRDARLARWGRETARSEAPLDEVPAATVSRIALPSDAASQDGPRFDPEAAALAVTLRDLRKKHRRWRWIPWRRGRRPELERLIGELSRQRAQLRAPNGGRRAPESDAAAIRPGGTEPCAVVPALRGQSPWFKYGSILTRSAPI
jgi:hypothetical protein